VEECPSNSISMAKKKASVDADSCIDCGVCVGACPEEAISME
jgi:Fe-S-cluster-containing hydrogenase component 2